jgi:hypothetical protein
VVRIIRHGSRQEQPLEDPDARVISFYPSPQHIQGPLLVPREPTGSFYRCLFVLDPVRTKMLFSTFPGWMLDVDPTGSQRGEGKKGDPITSRRSYWPGHPHISTGLPARGTSRQTVYSSVVQNLGELASAKELICAGWDAATHVLYCTVHGTFPLVGGPWT